MAEYTPAQFARALERAVGKTPKETVAVVRKGANNVKTDARRNVHADRPIHNAHAQQFINWDVEAQGVQVVAEIGYDKDAGKRPGRRTGPGGWATSWSSAAAANSSPHHDLANALETEEPRFTAALGDLGEGLIPG
jgi:hypothetical protein